MKTQSLRVLLCTVAALPAILSPTIVMSASANPTVTITNTTANPVPVSGSVTVGNAVVPVEVSNANPIPVDDTAAAGRQPARFGPLSIFASDTLSAMIPAVPSGKVFVVTSLNLIVESNVGQALTSARCILYVSTGPLSRPFAYFNLEPVAGDPTVWLSNPLLSSPLKAGEGLSIACNGAPPLVGAMVTATGYYIPAAS